MRIGLLGGSFNPAHAGHLHISRTALARLALDQLWWLVTPGNPLKPRSDLAPLSTRLAQAVRVARHPRIRVTGFEARRPDAFTVNSLQFLKQHHRGTRFVWVMGADALAGFHRWRRWRTIFRLCPIAIMDRPGYRFAAIASQAAHYAAPYRVDESEAPGLALLQPPTWCFLTLPLCPLSSTQIRAQQH
ncbi:MAG: nicotinate-nucleotide adenylyltransferase [Alphaproteobacteria bacterium]|nr:MAG: nicotinate-nucleotide adenylyltransferase [Alphaproteobacteria bacterium]